MANGFFSRLRRRNRRVVTLTLERGAVRALVTAGDSVIKWASAPLAPDAYSGGTVHAPEQVGAAIADLFRRQRIPKRDVVTSLSGIQTLYRTLTLPATQPKDLAAAIRYQAKREMPLKDEDLLLTWQVLDSSPERQEVFVVGTSRDAAGPFMAALSHARVRPKTIDLKPLALARLAGRPTALVVSLDPDDLQLVYLYQDVPMFARSAFFSTPVESVPELVDRVLDEFELSVRSYNASSLGPPIAPSTPLYLCGAAADGQLASALAPAISYTIEPVEPPLRYPAAFPLAEFATNLGLALRRS